MSFAVFFFNSSDILVMSSYSLLIDTTTSGVAKSTCVKGLTPKKEFDGVVYTR